MKMMYGYDEKNNMWDMVFRYTMNEYEKEMIWVNKMNRLTNEHEGWI